MKQVKPWSSVSTYALIDHVRVLEELQFDDSQYHLHWYLETEATVVTTWDAMDRQCGDIL